MNTPLGVPISNVIDSQALASYSFYKTITGDNVNAASNRPGVAATASATPHTVGSYVEAVSALSTDISGIYVQPTVASSSSAVDSSTLMNIAIGGAGSEVDIVSNIGIGYKVYPNLSHIFIPIKIAKGERVAFNVQSAQASKVITARFVFVSSKRKIGAAPKQIDTYGANTATSAGVTVSNPGAGNTKGSWTEIVSSTTRPIQGLFASIQGAQSTGISSGAMILDIGIGSAGNEQIIIPDALALTTTGESIDPVLPIIYMGRIPAGTRISARYSRSTTIAVDVIIHGIPY